MRTSFLKILALLGVISLPLSSCEEMDAIQLDKKIILTILDDHYGYGSGFETTIYSSSLIGFDKNDYINIESISFVVSDLQTQKTTDSSDIIASISVELFDLTNNRSIENSKIITDDISSSSFKSSVNLKQSLPDAPINLGIRIVNGNVNTCSWSLHAASLILVRK